jgi:hypothetical protein
MCGTIFNLALEKLSRDSEAEKKGSLHNGIAILGRYIDEWKEKMKQLKNLRM